jgi:hypothetical protein
MDLHLSQACRRYATQSSTSFFDRQLSDVHIANDESMKSSGANRSAKVVLVVRSNAIVATREAIVVDWVIAPKRSGSQDPEILVEN